MATTTNFGWETPDDTDLVKDGALAMRTLGNSIDTSFVDLKGGTTGQILSKASNTDLDYTWITNDVGDITAVTAGTGISGGGTTGAVTITNSMATAIDAKGDLIVGTGADTFDRLAVGTNGYVLTADSTATTGTKWAALPASASGLTFISRTTFSNVASQAFDNVFTSSYYTYLVVVENIGAATGTDDLQLQFRYAGPNTEAQQYYGNSIYAVYTGSTVSSTATNNAAQLTLGQTTGTTTGSVGRYYFYVNGVGNTSEKPMITGNGLAFSGTDSFSFSGGTSTERTYTGFLLKSSSTNITGTVTVYGLAKA